MVKVSKKIVFTLLCLVLVFSLTACGSKEEEKPEQAVSKAFDSLKVSDRETVKKYLNDDELIGSSGMSDIDEKLLFSKLNYKIVSSSTNGDSATVKTEITNTDLKAVLGVCLTEAINLSVGNALDPNAEQLSDEKMEKKIEQSFIDQLKKQDNKTVTTTVDINLAKNDNNWKLTMEKNYRMLYSVDSLAQQRTWTQVSVKSSSLNSTS